MLKYIAGFKYKKNKKDMVVPKAGDIFRFPLNATEFAFGRVMLNIQKQCIETHKIEKSNPLEIFKNIVLVELYKEISNGELPGNLTVLIPGILTSNGFINNGLWPVVGFAEVNPKDVEFPEGIATERSDKGVLVKGELRFVFNMDFEEVQRIGIFPQSVPGVIFAEIVLAKLGRESNIRDSQHKQNELWGMAKFDLRFSEHRKQVFDLLGLDPGESYYELSKRCGYDLNRFYQ